MAYKQAAKGKRYKTPVASFEYNLEKHLLDIENELKDEGYQPGGYHSFIIQKPKRLSKEFFRELFSSPNGLGITSTVGSPPCGLGG